MEQHTVLPPQKARAGRKSGMVRYVLTASLLLVVILFAVAYVITV